MGSPDALHQQLNSKIRWHQPNKERANNTSLSLHPHLKKRKRKAKYFMRREACFSLRTLTKQAVQKLQTKPAGKCFSQRSAPSLDAASTARLPVFREVHFTAKQERRATALQQTTRSASPMCLCACTALLRSAARPVTPALRGARPR